MGLLWPLEWWLGFEDLGFGEEEDDDVAVEEEERMVASGGGCVRRMLKTKTESLPGVSLFFFSFLIIFN